MSDPLRLYDAADACKDGYPRAWHESVKDAVREEAGYRCVRCGHPYRKGEHGNGQWSPCDEQCSHPSLDIETMYEEETGERAAMWRILTVHHLTGNKLDLRWWNLAALCQRCHLTIQGRVHMEQVFPFEHSEWFKPYAAGYYAATYLDEDLTREETMDRLDELLALELA